MLNASPVLVKVAQAFSNILTVDDGVVLLVISIAALELEFPLRSLSSLSLFSFRSPRNSLRIVTQLGLVSIRHEETKDVLQLEVTVGVPLSEPVVLGVILHQVDFDAADTGRLHCLRDNRANSPVLLGSGLLLLPQSRLDFCVRFHLLWHF